MADAKFLRAFKSLVWKAPRDVLVAPADQPFAFRTDQGLRRERNEDAVLVLTGRRRRGGGFVCAILCDGMGGLENGDLASQLATATVAVELARGDLGAPELLMDEAIRVANTAVHEKFLGKSGTVVVACLVAESCVVIGWVGDARAYGLKQGETPVLLSRDDTVATAVADMEGREQAEDALDSLLSAVGQKPDVTPHVRRVSSKYDRLLLVSDGVHRLQPSAFHWVIEHAHGASKLVDRLVDASIWEGGLDNASAAVVDIGCPPPFDEADGDVVAAWAMSQPRIWFDWEAPRASPAKSAGAKKGRKADKRRDPPTPQEHGQISKGEAARNRPQRPELSIVVEGDHEGGS